MAVRPTDAPALLRCAHALPAALRRRLEKAEKRAQLKKEGKLLSAKQRAEQERRQRAAEMFLRQAGIDPAAVGGCLFTGWGRDTLNSLKSLMRGRDECVGVRGAPCR